MATKASRIALAGSNISSTGEVDADLLDNIDSAAFLSLDGNGRLGIGTSSPISQLHVNKNVAGHNTDGITLGKVESAGWIDVNEEMGRLSWSASYGSSYTPGIGAYISAKADANWDGTETPTRLGFFTAPEGSTTPVERMRVNSLGNVGIGTSSMEGSAAAIKVEVESGSNYRPMRLRFTDDNNGSTNNPLSFEYKAGLEIENIYSGAAPSANGTKIAKLSLTTVTSSGYGATGSIFVTTNAGTGHNSGELAFAVGPNSSGLETEAMRINKDGNVGIGTNDPKRHLQIGATGSFPISFNGNYPDIHMNTYYESGWRIHTAGFGAKTTFNGATGAFGFSNVASSQSAGATFTPLERLTILANGNVGIGVANPGAQLSVNGPAALANLGGGSTGSSALYVNTQSNHIGEMIQVLRNGAIKMYMANDGDLALGHSSPSDKLDVQGADNGITIRSVTANRPVLSLINGSSTMLKISANGTYAAIGDGSNANRYMSFKGGYVGIGRTDPSAILDVANNTGSDTAADTMVRFDNSRGSDWNVVINNNNTTYGLDIRETPASGFLIYGRVTGGNNTFILNGNGNVKNANNSYGAISDLKLKENIIDATSQWEDIKALRIRKYSFKTDELDQPNQLGVIAQELETAGMGGLVNTVQDVDIDVVGKPLLDTYTKDVKYSVLYMKAVKALQEAMSRIETLEARLTAADIE